MWGGRTLPALVYIAGLFEAITYSIVHNVLAYCAIVYNYIRGFYGGYLCKSFVHICHLARALAKLRYR